MDGAYLPFFPREHIICSKAAAEYGPITGRVSTTSMEDFWCGLSAGHGCR